MRLAVAGGLLLASLVTGCEGPRCEPDDEVACGCEDGRVGEQSCRADGTFAPCRCGGGASAAMLSDEERRALAPLVLRSDKPGPDITNAWADDPAAARLGQRLFYDAGFAGRLWDGDNDGSEGTLGVSGDTGQVSCASCHVPDDAFADTRSPFQQLSLGAAWSERRSPSLLDVGHARVLGWDGRRDALFNQVFGPFESHLEMNTSRLFVAHRIFEEYREEYEEVFGSLPPLQDAERFPRLSPADTGCRVLPGAVLECRGRPGDAADYDGMAPEDQAAVTEVVVNVGKAVGAYLRLLSCGESAFDRWMKGEEGALSDAAVRGARLFVGKGDCVRCHSGPLLSDWGFHNVGLAPRPVLDGLLVGAGDRGAGQGIAEALADPLSSHGPYSDGDDGRLPAEVGPAHEGAFRTPSLRCTSQQPSFMHTGHMSTLEEVVAFFAEGGDPFGYPGTSEIQPLDLDEGERADLVELLRALEGPGPPAHLRRPPG